MILDVASPGDAGHIMALLEQAALPTDDVREHLDDFLVMRESDRTIVGCIGLEHDDGDVGLLRSLVIEPSRRGGGIGARLTAALVSRAASLDMRALYLLTTDAGAFFARHGFEPIPRDLVPPPIQATREFASLCPASAVVMRRDLAIPRPSAGSAGARTDSPTTDSPASDRPASSSPPIALGVYETMASAYAERAETKPHNAHYERPATRALVPPVAGRRVLDAGCGPGINTAWLVERGARVVGLDVSPAMVRLARARLRGRATILRANLERPLEFLPDTAFDLVLCALVLDHVRDWRPLFSEFVRLLRPGGSLVCSFTHPTADLLLSGTERYFEIEMVEYTWTGFGEPLQVPGFRRPLGAVFEPLREAGLVLDRLVEPLPTAAFRDAEPAEYAKLHRRPGFLCLRATRP